MTRPALWLTAILAGVLVVADALRIVPEARGAQRQPNIVVVLTDDQRSDEMRHMPLTRNLLGTQGTTFSSYLSTYPLCCPSRSTMLSGQYMHNHEVRHNSPPDGGHDAFDYSTALPVWLQRAGYRTAHIGKPCNGYGVRYDVTPDMLNGVPTPPGYDDWWATIDPTTYEMYGYAIQENGVVKPSSGTSTLYQTDAIADRAVTDIRRWAPDDRPFYIEVATSAPHSELHNADGGPTPALRHFGTFATWPFRPDASFDEEDVSDKPSVVQGFPRFTSQEKSMIADRERSRLEALQSVDELVGRVVSELDRAGELDNTVIMYTSDNGWFNGEHRWFSEKIDAYEPAVRVPLVVRGPGFPAGATRDQPTANIDIVPTIVELAGATASRVMDGESLLTYAASSRHRRDRAIGLEASFPEVAGLLAVYGKRYAGVNVFYEGVRTNRYKYVSYYKDRAGKPAEEEQLYDLRTDPFELRSLHRDPAHDGLKSKLRAKLGQLRRCKGGGCRQSFVEKRGTRPKRAGQRRPAAKRRATGNRRTRSA